MSDWRNWRKAWQVRHSYTPTKVGEAELSLFTVDGLTALQGVLHGFDAREGDTVMQLLVGGQLWMSDTNDEYRDHIGAINSAKGRVLVHGLGLGCYLSVILTKPTVEHVDVVEIHPDVLAIISPHYSKDRVTFHQGDCFTKRWPRGTHWDYAWHDVWNSKCTDDLEAHSRLLRSFGRRVGAQGAWAHEELVYRRRVGC